MTLFPIDAARNARMRQTLEPVLEDMREAIARFSSWGDAGFGDVEGLLEAYDMARPRLNLLGSLLLDAQVSACVDISTGPGFLPVFLKRLGIEVAATERNPPISIFALSSEIPVREYHIGRDQPPFLPQSLDAVIFAEVLEHLKLSPVQVLNELASLLSPGARLWLTTPNIARLAHVEALAAGENFLEPFPEDLPPRSDPTDYIEHVREYSVREVVEAVEAAGLEVRQVLMTGWGVNGYDPLLNPFANDIIVVEAVK